MHTSTLASSLRTVVSALHKGLRKHSSSVHTYSMTEMETIGLLTRNDALLPTELAALTRVKTQSMSQILSKMEAQGIIVRTPSTSDKRKVYISLSDHGKRIVEQTMYDRDEWLRGVIEQSLTEAEQQLLAKALPLLNKLVAAKS